MPCIRIQDRCTRLPTRRTILHLYLSHESLEQRYCANARCLRKQRNEFLIEDSRQRIGPASAPWLCPDGGRSRIGLDPIGCGATEASIQRGGLQLVFCLYYMKSITC